MNARELVDRIRSGPALLALDEPLRFRRRTRSNPCDFNEFLRALQSGETIQMVKCETHLNLGITEDEWCLLVKTIGRIKGIDCLWFHCKPGSRDFHPFQAVAAALNNAHSLDALTVVEECGMFPGGSSGMIALANALREHTSLREFGWIDCSRMEEGQITAVDPVLWALPACRYLQQITIVTKYASADALKNLLQLRPAIELRLVSKWTTGWQWLTRFD